MIERKGKKFILKSKGTGKLLGTHETKKEALAQEQAININKAKKKK